MRALAARWLGLDVVVGRHFGLDTSTVSVLGDDRGTPVVLRFGLDTSTVSVLGDDRGTPVVQRWNVSGMVSGAH